MLTVVVSVTVWFIYHQHQKDCAVDLTRESKLARRVSCRYSPH